MSDIAPALEYSDTVLPATAHHRTIVHRRPDISSGALGWGAGIVIRLLMLSVVIALVRSPPGDLR